MQTRHAGWLRIGLISDTHGLLRPEVHAFLAGSNHIVHAGDIGNPGILDALRALAPLTAVRGNNDHGDWAERLRECASLRLGEVVLHVLHDLSELAIDPAEAGVRVVVSGHSHRPSVSWRDGVLYVNPGSAGPRRFRLPIAAAELQVQGREITPHVREFAA